MIIFISVIILLCLAVIGYIYYENQVEPQQKPASAVNLNEIDLAEQERINKARQEKQRIEKEKLEHQEDQAKLLSELRPILEKFIIENDYKPWLTIMDEAEMIIKGESISLQELLQHNVNRRFTDGTPYKVGLTKRTEETDYSLSPEKVEALQTYYICFLEFYSQIISKSYTIDKLVLHRMIYTELKNQLRR